MQNEKEKKRLEALEVEKVRRAYLLSLDDIQANSLPTIDKYDRIRYLREIEAADFVRRRQATVVQPQAVILPLTGKKDNTTPYYAKEYGW